MEDIVKKENLFTRIKNKVTNKYKEIKNKFESSVIGGWICKFFSKGDRKFVACLYLISFAVFFTTLVTNRMVIAISGDFKLQEIPFYYNGYDDWWTSIKNAEYVMWDDSGFLGQNNIGTNTFYYLWNIFFLPTLLVPRSLVPQALAFLIVTKFVLAGFVMKKLLSYMGVSSRSAKIVATAYAFSGWAFYYLWFNHFLEIAVLFPLVLYGTEKLFKEKKVGWLIISLFISALTNYFFFIMFCFCGVIYALFRYFQLWSTWTKKERLVVILIGIASYAIAILMACLILIPAFKVAMQSSRAKTEGGYLSQIVDYLKAIKDAFVKKDIDTMFKEIDNFMKLCFSFSGTSAKKYNMYPIISYFFPPYSCYDSPLFSNTGYDNTNCSLFMYTPLTLMLIPSLIQSIKERKISHIIGFLGSLLMIFSPFFYYCFTGFTTVMYGRWQLFITAIACIYIAFNFDKIKQMKAWYFDISIAVCVIMEVLMIILALKYQGQMSSNTLLSSTYVDDRIYYTFAQLVYILICFIFIRNQFNKEKFGGRINLAIAIEAIVVGNILLMGQGTVSYEELYGGIDDSTSATKLISNIKKNDKTYYRIFNTDADRDGNNMGMVQGYRGVGTFHSMYNYELNEFAEWSRLTYSTSSSSWRPWSMGVHEKRADLNTFLGIKYYVVNANDSRIEKNGDMLAVTTSGVWNIGETTTSFNATLAKYITKDSGGYVIKSITRKSSNDTTDVYTVTFETITSEGYKSRAYNITIPNTDAVDIYVGEDNLWYFKSNKEGEKPLMIASDIKGPGFDMSDGTNGYSISRIQKLESEGSNDIYALTFTNGEVIQYIICNGEDTNIPFGYKEVARDEYNVVYENENFINLGFAFSNLMDSSKMSSTDYFLDSTYYARTIKNEAAYVRYGILAPEDIDEINEAYPGVFKVSSDSPYTAEDIANDIRVINVNDSYIQVVLQNWDHDKGVATTYADPVNYPANSISQIYWNSYMDVDLSSYNAASEAKERGGAFISVNARMGENLLVTLYGENEDGDEYELTRDIHMRHNYDKSGDWKYERGFYVDDKVTRIRIRAYDTFKKGTKFAKPNVTIQYYDTYKANIDKLKKYSLEDVKVGVNTIKFKTNYDTTKMEVLTIPYDEGWSLTRKDASGNKEKVKLYKAQGGFNSFVAEEGDYTYTLSYVTPGLKTGIAGFIVGSTLFAMMYVAFDIELTNKNKLKKQLSL